MFAKGDLVNSRYEVTGIIGSGGTSTVYLVADRHIGKMLAMKVMDVRRIGSLDFARSEIESLRRVRYPLVPRIIDAFREDDHIFILSEYVKGESLASMCRGRGMDREASLLIAQRVCEALIYLHELKEPILYLDMKPENIIMSDDGMPHLIDFGIAGWLSGKNIAVGTAGYSPPEQYRMDERMDESADIFAFGMTYYAMRSGIPPDADPPAALDNIRHSRILNKHERSFLKKCCALSKEDRYTNARTVLTQIKHIRSIPYKLKRTIMTTALLAGLLISSCVLAVKIKNGVDGNEAASYLLTNATRYMKDGEYTPEGIGIIKACIRSGRLPEEVEQEFIFEVAMNSMLVSKDYRMAYSFFARLDPVRFPEADEYKRLCHIQSGFDFDPEEAEQLTRRLFTDMAGRAPSVMKYENMIFIANCFENYDRDHLEGLSKAISVLSMTKRELDELSYGGSVMEENEIKNMRDRVESIIRVKQKRMRAGKK